MKGSLILTFITTLLIAGCGGGGGGSLKAPNYAGAWSGYVDLVDNTCPRAIPSEFKTISLLHNVDQGVSEDAFGNTLVDVVLNDGRDTYVGIGEVDQNGEGHRFSVTGNPNELPGFLKGFTCIEIIDFEYNSIDFKTDTAGFVSRHSSITCTQGSNITTCDVTYTGSSYRSAAS